MVTVLPPLGGHNTPSDVQLNDVIKPKSLLLHATPFSGTVHNASDESESDASGECHGEREQDSETQVFVGRDATEPLKTSLVSQWTGAPIRAIIPLPRRGIALNGTRSVSAPAVVGPSPGLVPWVVQSRVWDDIDSEDEDEGEVDNEDSLGKGTNRAEYCSYESITAAEGLAAWSFEELRVECYAQSLIARGTKPPPVVQRSLAIPPAFAPRIVQRELDPHFPVSCK